MKIKKIIRYAAMVIVFGLIIISFMFFGINDSLVGGGGQNTVLSAGSRTVSALEFRREFDGRRQQMEQQFGQPVTAEQAAAQGLDTQLLSALAVREAVNVVLTRLGVRPGQEMVLEQIRTVPQFFDQVTGRFDGNAYRRTLADAEMTPDEFEQGLADEITINHMYSVMGSGIRAPYAIAAIQALINFQERDVNVLLITPNQIEDVGRPTEEQLAAFMEENRADLEFPESRTLSILRFSRSALLPTVEIDEQQVQDLFEFRRDQIGTPETRTLIQISARDRTTAQTISQRLMAGEDPQAVADALGANLVRQENRPRTALPDAAVAEVAFSLGEGETSGPIDGDLGFSVVQVQSITPAQMPDLEEMRSQMETEARQRAAEIQVSETADQFEDLRDDGMSMIQAAEQLGLEVTTTDPIISNGVNRDGQPAPGVNQRLLQEAFRLAEGEESEIIASEPGEYFVVRVESVTPPQMPPMEEVREVLTETWIARQKQTRMQEKAAEVLARAQAGESLEDLAAELGAPLQPIPNIGVNNAQQLVQQVGQPLIEGAISAKEGEFFSGMAPGPIDPGVQGFVGKVEEVRFGDMGMMAQQAVQISPQVSQALTAELEEQFVAGASALVDVQTYPDRARQAIGVAPAAQPAQ